MGGLWSKADPVEYQRNLRENIVCKFKSKSQVYSAVKALAAYSSEAV